MTQLPDPYYTLIETSRGNDRAIVVVNTALRKFDGRDQFKWHLKVTIKCSCVRENGMPFPSESEPLENIESEISSHIAQGDNAVFLARITCRGMRELVYRVHDPEAANDALIQLTRRGSQLREWEFLIQQDVTWNLAEPELDLIGRDPRIN